MSSLSLKNIGRIKSADISFGDFTVFVGPQATGKTTVLQWLKLVLDRGAIQEQLKQYGYDWGGSESTFLELYFGEGMGKIAAHPQAEIAWDKKKIDLKTFATRKATGKKNAAFVIPAQRVLAMREGWPRGFGDFSRSDPFTMRAFSETLRWLAESELAGADSVFPRKNRLNDHLRKQISETVFNGQNLVIDTSDARRRFMLEIGEGQRIPNMVWSAGQREFVPLLLGLYWLFPAGGTSQRDAIKWVIVEEPEMGLHPRAMATVLLLCLEALSRGYKLCLSTHSPHVLDLVWALNQLRQSGKAKGEDVMRVLGLKKEEALKLKSLGEAILDKSKKIKTYFFDPSGKVEDISSLDTDNQNQKTQTWGELIEYAARSSLVVIDVLSRPSK